MSVPFTPENMNAQHELGFDWVRHALTCSVGDYQVVTPSEPGQGGGAYMLRKGRPFLAFNEKETNLFDDSGERLLFSLTRATSAREAQNDAHTDCGKRAMLGVVAEAEVQQRVAYVG